jgi:hypothetical protein
MNKLFYLIIFFVFFTFSAEAQFTVTGQLKDTIGEPVSSATVMLLSAKDSTLMNFTASDSKGNFAFKNIQKANYILKISHFNYMPQVFIINPTEEKEINYGVIEMKQIAQFLMEVVIREAKAPIFIKGDTVEYDASTFKVPPGSTVEDLLRKLPGIDVDADGTISTMGKEVKTVYVDGKNFFGNNPKTVTQNLDANAVSKVQVFTEKSEQEKITGIADGSKEKVMNLELKEEYKKGYFGKATLGYGMGQSGPDWQHCWLARGNFNWFTDKQQLSFIGYGNNLNQTSMDWGDRQDFYGQSMQTGRDNGDFGFNTRRGGGFNIMFSSRYSDNYGFSTNGGGGVNYNYFNKKIKYNAGYFYSVNNALTDSYLERNTFLDNSTSFFRLDTNHVINLRQNHNFSTRFECDMDSNNNIVVRANLEYAPAKRNNTIHQLFQTSEKMDINFLSIDNTYKNDNLNFDVLTIYNHKFKKKGRTFAWSGYYSYKDGNNLEDINNKNEFFNIGSESDFIKFIVKNNKNSEDHNVKSSVLYVEPLGKRFSLMSFYNFRNTLSYNKNFSTDPENANADVDSLWLNYRNNILYNRVGASINYAHNGINLRLGGAFQSLILNASCETRPYTLKKLDPKSYNNFIPYFSANLDLPKNFYVSASYSYDVSEPNISYLFPMPNLTNTLYKVLGNQNLAPERNHELNAQLSYWNNASMVNASIDGSARFYDSQIVYNQLTDYIENQGFVTVSTPDNVKGGNNFSIWLWTSFPIVKTKLTMNISGGGRISNSPVFINAMENNTNSKGYNASLGLTLNLGQKLSFMAGANVSQTFTKYSINFDRNQSYINYGANISGKWQMLKKTFLEASYRFSDYVNKKLDFEQPIHTLTASVRQVVGKKNQWEFRLAAVDLLNQNKFIFQTTTINYVEYRTAPTLGRYFMLTAAYNIKGFETKNSNNRNIIY